MQFVAYTPDHPLLHPYIRSIWYIKQHASEAVGMNPRMIPDGDYHMVINLGAHHEYIDKTGRRIQPKRSHMNALQTEHVTIERSGHVEMMGVVFRAYGYYPFVRMPVSEVVGDVRNMEDVMHERFDLLEERLASAPDVQSKCRLMEQWLRSRMCMSDSHPCQGKSENAIAFAGRMIARSNGMMRIKELADKSNLSERSLERNFKTVYGITPKQYADLSRIHHVLKHMRSNGTSLKLLDYALAGEYYDQAHFIRMFKNVVGVTPRSYLQNNDLLSDLYNTNPSHEDTIGTK